MQWGHPDYVFLYFVIPLLWLVLFFYSLWRKRAQRGVADADFFAKILPGASPWLRRSKTTLKIAVLLLLVLAFMEPKWGSKEEEVTMHGVDMMVLVDVSNSMLAQDISPSRMERVKRKFRDLIDLLAGDRVGLVAFAGRSFLLSPLTIDYGTLELFVDELAPSTIPVQGTDLAGAIELAIKAMPQDDTPKALMVFTDGEDHSEKMEQMTKELEEKKVRVFIMGVGTPEGAPIPLVEGGFKSTAEGKPIVSKLEEPFLKDLALNTDGAYVRTVTGDQDLKELYLKGVRGVLDPHELKASRKRIWESRFYFPLGAALGLLAIERLLPEARQRKGLNAKPAKS